MTDDRTANHQSQAGHDHRHSHHGHGQHEPLEATGKVKDPVCGMMVDPHTTTHRAQYQGNPYYFCSSGCQSKFMAEPANYAAPATERKADAVPEGTIYTCPMHPEIRQVGPGSCPICGMALEPVLATAETGPSHELVDMTRRFWIGLVLTLPVFALDMGGHLVGIDHLVHADGAAPAALEELPDDPPGVGQGGGGGAEGREDAGRHE